MAKFINYIGYSNVYADDSGRRYLSGIVHPTAAAAMKSHDAKGKLVSVVQVIWDEESDINIPAWGPKS